MSPSLRLSGTVGSISPWRNNQFLISEHSYSVVPDGEVTALSHNRTLKRAGLITVDRALWNLTDTVLMMSRLCI